MKTEDLDLYGEIEFYNKKKNLGMIGCKGGVIFCFHRSNLRDKDIKKGERVIFQARKSNITGIPKYEKKFAKNIRRYKNEQ